MDFAQTLQEGILERDGNDVSVQFYRWSLVAELCASACDIAQTTALRGEKLDAARVFELAMLEILQDDTYSKNDLAELSAMLMLGSRAVKKLCGRTQGFMLGPVVGPGEDNAG